MNKGVLFIRVIYIDIDSMRPKHIGSYGYHRNTTPNIDKIAAQGTYFTNVYCASSPCVPARAAFASGLFGIHSGVVTHWGPGSIFRPNNDFEHSMFVPLLRKNGYKAVTFSSFADRHDAYWFMAGWNEVHTHTQKKGDENADEVMNAVIPWLEEHGHEDDYFLHLQLWDPHRQYTMPKEYLDYFKEELPPEWPDSKAIKKHQDSYAPFGAKMLFPGSEESPFEYLPNQIKDREDFTQFVNAYDSAIRFMDDQLGRLFSTLEKLKISEDTAIIISADHGEAMGEHSVYGDHVCADEAVHNIPLIIKWPGSIDQNIENNHLIYNVDIIATICELLEITVPQNWDGYSFSNLIVGNNSYTPREYLVWEHGLYSVTRAVRTPEWLMMRTYHPGVVPLEPIELYKINEDPYMINNLAEEKKDKVQELDHMLMQWWHDMVGLPGAIPDPLPEVIRTGPYKYIKKENWKDYLRASGNEELLKKYVEAIRE